MNDQPKSWKVVALGPAGTTANENNFGFRLLYSFPTREEAEKHAECFRAAGMKCILREIFRLNSDVH